jgi:hypothetical protein
MTFMLLLEYGWHIFIPNIHGIDHLLIKNRINTAKHGHCSTSHFLFSFSWWGRGKHRVSLCSLDLSRTCDLPVSASWVLGLLACATMPDSDFYVLLIHNTFKSSLSEIKCSTAPNSVFAHQVFTYSPFFYNLCLSPQRKEHVVHLRIDTIGFTIRLLFHSQCDIQGEKAGGKSGTWWCGGRRKDSGVNGWWCCPKLLYKIRTEICIGICSTWDHWWWSL